MNVFGGDWTKIKIEILVEYAKAYLTIMNKKPYFKLLYFDGFAGSGFIIRDSTGNDANINYEITIGAAKRIVEIEDPKSFDEYYFVDTNPKNLAKLQKVTANAYPQKRIHIVNEDCNKKLKALAEFLQDHQNNRYRILAYIDPCGMQVEWDSIESLKGLPIDMWVLVPTGLGVNRLLKKNGDISVKWLNKLERFLGLNRNTILNFFYTEQQSLFPDQVFMIKEKNAIEKSAELYNSRLQEVFDHVSKPFELRNSTNSIMYHLFLTSNTKAAIKIGNDIVKKYSS